MEKRWRVPLPRRAEPPYRVYVNGVPQVEGREYDVVGRELHFARPLRKEGKLGMGRWAAMFLGLFGTYRQNDSVDVQYRLNDRDAIATGLEILPPPGEREAPG
jgi:hypothetical protein